MGGSAKKSTKKFEKRHLKDVLEKRKGVAKIKQRKQMSEKKKARRAKDEARVHDESEETKLRSMREQKDAGAEKLKNMSFDEFFQGGFEVPIAKANSPSQKSSTKRKHEEIDDGDINGEGSSDELLMEEKISNSAENSSDSEDGTQDHMQDLQALAQNDPDFYKYLKENDAELLEFRDDGETEKSNEADEPSKKKAKSRKDNSEMDVTGVNREFISEDQEGQAISLAMISKWRSAIVDQSSLRAMREVVLAFRAAAHSNEEDETQFKYMISSPEVYHEVLITAMKHVPNVLKHHLPVKETAAGKVRVPTDSKKYRTLAPTLNSYAISMLRLLENLSDARTLELTLSSIELILPYILSFKKILKTLLKSIVGIWSDISNSETTRIRAFLVVKRLAVIGDVSLKEAVLKSVYQGLVQGSRNTTIHTLSGINIMKNSAVQLWGLDHNVGYTTGFTYIRQLAIHLRGSISQPTKDSYKAVYNWQYVHSLDFWSRVLSAHCSPSSNIAIKKPSDSQLHPLIYPLVQITLGALRLIPTPIYFPLRFHLVRCLLRISQSTNTYIPLAPAIIEVLQSPEMKEPSRPSTLKPIDYNVTLRAPKTYSRTKIYQDGLGEQVTELLAEFFGIWAKNIAFPELTIPPSVLMKRWIKDVSSPPGKSDSSGTRSRKGNRNQKLISSVQLLLQKMATNATYVEERRAKVDFAPGNRAGVEGFLRDVEFEDLPMGAFVIGLRRQKEERERVLEEARKDDERRKKEDERERARNMEQDSTDDDDEEVEE